MKFGNIRKLGFIMIIKDRRIIKCIELTSQSKDREVFLCYKNNIVIQKFKVRERKNLMDKRLYDFLEIIDLKDMLNKTRNLYKNRPAYKIRIDSENKKYMIITHEEVRKMVDCLGTALCDLGL